ncbi:urease accessory protein UreF [Nocardioides stalactiti]|uniref:urease accessory protein UreF n=1 Tax=Nocardioides stalactiti TaxID=2755356 RepID=UPI001FE98E42|nr:urease accessory UreF family protein [Nocardioides stalactiti]
MHPDLLLMLLADARLPVAGHTQSATVEAAIAHGLTTHDVPAYVRTRLQSVTLVEAGTAVVARHAALTGASVDVVETAWAARTPSAALRASSRGQGRALVRLAGRLWPEVLPGLAEVRAPGRATVLGVVAAHLALGPEPLARLIGYDDVQTVCAAVLKLAPTDPSVVTGWVVDSLPDVDRLAATVAHLEEPADVPAVGCPQIEAWAEAHARTSRRLFRA